MSESKKNRNTWVLFAVAILSIVLMIVALNNIIPNDVSDNMSFETTNPVDAEEVVKVISGNNALTAIKESALAWAADAQFISCTGSATITVNTAVYGYEQGKFANWNCFVYSKTLNQDTTVVWKNDIVTVKEPHITYTGSETENDPATRIYYDMDSFISANDVISIAINEGFDIENNFPGISFGSYTVRENYGEQPVWELREFDRNETNKEVRIYYIDALTNEFLSVTNSN